MIKMLKKDSNLQQEHKELVEEPEYEASTS